MAPCIFPEIMVATFFSKISFFHSGCWTLKINFGWNNTVCSKDMEIGSFPQKWMWRPYMVDLCSIPFDASRPPLQLHEHLPSVVLTLSINPQKGQKSGGFSPKIPQKCHSGITTLPRSRYSIRNLKRRIFRPFSHVFTGGRTWRFLSDFQIAIWRTKWRQNVKPPGLEL